LLVEDNPDEVALAELAFKKSQIPNRLVVARDGLEALDYLFCCGNYLGRDSNDKPALILLNLNLPGLDGFGVLKEIQSNVTTSSIPVVVLTNSIEEKDRSESLRLGAQDFISKPPGFSQFVEVVQQLSARWLS
jgi:two-component system response regulator